MSDLPALPRVILCADDFAQTPAISATIAELARARCINAVSCMAVMPNWPQDARLLDGIEAVNCGALGPVQVGLHLVLSSERPLGPMSCMKANGHMPSADRMLALALTGRLDPDEIAAEIDRQFAAFRAARGKAPDFVDAHQHVHLYPGIRSAVIRATLRHAPRAWVRVPDERLGPMLARPYRGKAIGSTLHALGFRRQLQRAGLRTNDSFAGHYAFAGAYARRLRAFLRCASRAHLIMCHPGSGVDPQDSIAAARIAEAQVIAQMPLEERVQRAAARWRWWPNRTAGGAPRWLPRHG